MQIICKCFFGFEMYNALMSRMLGIGFLAATLFFSGTSFVQAQEFVPDTVTTAKAKVLEVVSQERRLVPGTDTESIYQTIRAVILSGEEQDKIVTIENDYLQLTVDQVFYLSHTTNDLDGSDYYAVAEVDRIPALAILGILFVAVVLFFGGKQGARGLLALLGGLLFIVFLLLPSVLNGYSPVLVSVVVASIIVTLGSYVTHGFNKTTTTAVLGMITTIIFTGTLAYFSIDFAQLSGFSSDETVYLNFNTRGVIDFAGLLLGGILIGTLGVLYDAAIGQSVAVEELASAGKHLSRKEIYKRALRIGREHIGALVNTLAIAYVGASLPLLLLFYGFGSDSFLLAINREIFATEIVRTIVGSIGIVLTVPITTAIATRLLVEEKRVVG